LPIPSALAEATRRRAGEAGERWLRDLPGLIATACEQWGCTVSGEAGHGEVAIVLPVQHADGPAVLKVSFPHPGSRGEAGALRHFGGVAAVRLLAASSDGFTLLLERAGPQTLDSVPSVEETIEIAGHLARRLAVPAPPETVSLAATAGPWLEELDRQVTAAPALLSARTIERARELIEYLARDRTATMLHADLHFGNVLRSSREPWLVIDPKGWTGTAAFDAFTVIAGRRRELERVDDLAATIADRIARFSRACGVDSDLALRCCQARAASTYLHQIQHAGDWFDLDFLRCLLES
jgi:streptomycin 6-kinase